MFFGGLSVDEAEGAILAHSVMAGQVKLKKGSTLTASDVQALRHAGIEKITVAKLEADDIGESEAAQSLGEVVASPSIQARAPFAGRVNLFAKATGLLCYDQEKLQSVNLIDEAVCVALKAPLSQVKQGQMIGTIKIIPYALPSGLLRNAVDAARGIGLQVTPFGENKISLILTRSAGMSEKLITKGEQAVAMRLAAFDAYIDDLQIVKHEQAALAGAIKNAQGNMVLILTAQATADRRDVAPAALVEAGGELIRYGIPVDPGNLLFMGSLENRSVIGLPGCVRAPVLNGTDFVLARLLAGIAMKDSDFAQLGCGGFLKESAHRPMPRLAGRDREGGKIAAVILAAGFAKRMHGRDKILELVNGQPLLARLIGEAKKAQIDDVFVVLPKQGYENRRAVAQPLALVVDHPNPEEGMGSSIRLAVENLGADYEALLFLLGDMPEINAQHLNLLIGAYSPQDEREIIRAASANGQPGHPVLFGRRFFEPLMQLSGDIGAKSIVQNMEDFVETVRLPAEAAITDLDTPEDWLNWRKKNS